MIKKYEVIGAFPLEFQDRQQAETGETFERDFAASIEGEENERWLITCGLIREIVPISQPPARQVVKPDTE